MTARQVLVGCVCVAVFMAPWTESVCLALDPANVLVLYNQDSNAGVQIADHYAQVRPGVHLLALTGVSQAEQASAEHYLDVIRPQVLSFLNAAEAPAIDVIVTTKGLPLRIYNAQENPGTYPGWRGEAYGTDISDDWWKQYSSLESELTRIDLVSSTEQMGDQAYFISPPLFSFPTQHHAANPYYGSDAPFDRAANEGIRLTARLDGFSAADVKAALDRAPHATLNAPGNLIVLDDDPDAPGASGDQMENLASLLSARGVAYSYDGTDAFVATAAGPAYGYVGHGRHGGAPAGYLAPGGALDLILAPGAVFHTYESFNAYSFTEGGNRAGQGLIAEWIARGGTAGVGHVEEPYVGAQNITNEDRMFEMLLDGHTFAEAAWAATMQLSYVNTVVGDPLMTFEWRLPGDVNQDWVVDYGGDVSVAVSNYLETDVLWAGGDINHDGIVDYAGDISVMVNNYGAVSGDYPPSAGELELVIDTSTGEVSIVANGATNIAGFELRSPGGDLITGNYTDTGAFQVDLQAAGGASEFNLAGGSSLDGIYSLGLIWGGGMDWTFSYNHVDDTAPAHSQDDVTYMPEPATMSLLFLGGLALLRRRPGRRGRGCKP